MGLRLSISEAKQKKIIAESQAKEMRRLQSAGRSAGARSSRANTSRSTSKLPFPFCPVEGSTPQQKLWRALVARYPDLVKRGELCWEVSGVVPGRKYSLDIAFTKIHLGLEMDGWEWHGKNINNFKRDRQKDRLLLLAGWRVLRFFASEVNDDIESVLKIVEQVRTMLIAESKVPVAVTKISGESR